MKRAIPFVTHIVIVCVLLRGVAGSYSYDDPQHGRGLLIWPICGNYCGPGWCGGQLIGEDQGCDFDVAPEGWNQPTGPTCADSCCKAHDMCCGTQADTSGCNDAIVRCMSECSILHGYTGTSCTAHGIPFSATLILETMRVVDGIGLCCGSPCPSGEEGSSSSSTAGGGPTHPSCLPTYHPAFYDDTPCPCHGDACHCLDGGYAVGADGHDCHYCRQWECQYPPPPPPPLPPPPGLPRSTESCQCYDHWSVSGLAGCDGALSDPRCEDECEYSADGDCDDGGDGAEYVACSIGTDCTDCGTRTQSWLTGCPSVACDHPHLMPWCLVRTPCDFDGRIGTSAWAYCTDSLPSPPAASPQNPVLLLPEPLPPPPSLMLPATPPPTPPLAHSSPPSSSSPPPSLSPSLDAGSPPDDSESTGHSGQPSTEQSEVEASPLIPIPPAPQVPPPTDVGSSTVAPQQASNDPSSTASTVIAFISGAVVAALIAQFVIRRRARHRPTSFYPQGASHECSPPMTVAQLAVTSSTMPSMDMELNDAALAAATAVKPANSCEA